LKEKSNLRFKDKGFRIKCFKVKGSVVHGSGQVVVSGVGFQVSEWMEVVGMECWSSGVMD
jgi:hypothetical protein